MSLSSLEKAIWTEAKQVLNNPKMKLKELLEWSTGEVKPDSDDEIVLHLPKHKVNICVPKSVDKRS